jgi:DNA-binding winged helix-turn-helix (wHTH) protein/tetratricopeptide (TPR) repeat protein
MDSPGNRAAAHVLRIHSALPLFPAPAMTASMTQQQQTGTWSIGPYWLDADGHLSLGTSAVPLSPLQRRLLLSLVRHAGQVLEKETLLHEVWGHTQVSDVSLARAVHGLRRILDNGPLGSRVIRTIYGSGYRFDGPVSQPTAQGITGSEPDTSGFPSAESLGHFVEGLVQVRHRDPRQLPNAAEHFRRCLNSAPGFAPAQLQLAATLVVQYQWGQVSAGVIEGEVESLLRQAESSGSVTDQARALRMEVLTLLHWQPQLAEESFGAWLPQQLPPGPSRHGWVRHLLATGRAEEALALVEPELSGDNPSGWFLAGLSQLQMGRLDGAIATLRKPLRIDSTLAAPRWLLALSLAQANRGKEALQELAQCCLAESQPDSLEAALALVLALSGEGERAAGMLGAALRRGREPLPMATLWGLVALSLGEDAAAARLLERAVQERCGLAPFAWQWSGLDRLGDSAALRAFRARMADQFHRQDLHPSPAEAIEGFNAA